MAADVLTYCLTGTSAAMVLTVQDKEVIVFRRQEFSYLFHDGEW